MKISYIDSVTIKILFFSLVSMIAVPYYFAAGGTLLGFIIIRLVAMLFGFCSQIGWHRWLTHRSFEPSALGRILLFLGMLFNGLGRPLHLVVSHIHHHKHSDTETDPHSPKYHNFLNLWLGRFTTINGASVPKTFFKDKQVLFFNKHYWTMFWIVNLIFCLIDFKSALIFCPVTIVYSWTLVTMVNYFGHKDKDEIGPRNLNSKLLTFLSGGEGLHKNHHDDPSNYSFGSKDRFDPGKPLIKYILMKR